MNNLRKFLLFTSMGIIKLKDEGLVKLENVNL
jgi:hypothetical protein